MIKIIYDNDAAPDDMIALLYLLNHSNVNLAAITIPGTGEAHGSIGAKNIANLLDHLKMPNIPIAYSEDQRCSDDQIGARFPEWLRNEMDAIFKNTNISENANLDIRDNALALMHEVISQSEESITILATGPLTNIAKFIDAYPGLCHNIENIVVMGGAVNVPGNINVFHQQTEGSQAELNLYADPEAAKKVFESGVKVTLVPLDATNQVPLTREFVEGLAAKKTPALKIIYRLLKDQVDAIGEKEFYSQFYLWDPLAAMLCVDAELGSVERMFIAFDPAKAETKPVEKAEESTGIINVITHIVQPQQILSRLVGLVERNEQDQASVVTTGLFSSSNMSDVNTLEKRTATCGL